jgi:hypothetical protein
MPASGQSRRFGLLSITSALPRTPDVSRFGRHFAFVPKAAMALYTDGQCSGRNAVLTIRNERYLAEDRKPKSNVLQPDLLSGFPPLRP